LRHARRIRAASVVVALALVLAGCAGSSQSSSVASGGGGTTAPIAPEATIAKSPEWTTSIVRVDGVGVSVSCRGEAKDRPPVVFVSGIGLDAKGGWLDSGVPDQVAATTKVCAYDRPGLGASDPAPSERSIENQVDELASLLDAAEITDPVVLVAQGYGTLIARQFATPKNHLTDIAGLVLIDPPLWPLLDSPPAASSSGVRAEYDGLADVNTSLGLYGAGAMPPPPVPVVVVSVDGERPNRPGQPIVRPTAPTIVTTTTPDTVPPESVPPESGPPESGPPESGPPESGPAAVSEQRGAAPTAIVSQGGPPVGTSAPLTTDSPSATTAPPAGSSLGTVPPLVPSVSDRTDAQRQLVAKGTFATLVELVGAGSEAQFWVPDRIAALIVGLPPA